MTYSAVLSQRARFETWLLVSFLILNATLFLFAEEKVESGVNYSATYWNASDGQRYWGVAINLAAKGEFTVPTANNEPLTRAGPLPALIFSAPISLVGFDHAPVIIVGLQCFLLYLMGAFAHHMTPGREGTRRLAQVLVAFNPNLVGLAHHAQSDLIFSFFLAAMLCLGMNIVRSGNRVKWRWFVLLGFSAGCLTLARPAGQFYSILFPLFLLFSIIFSDQRQRVTWRVFWPGAAIYFFCFILVTTPWAIRNHNVLDDFGLSQSEAIMMKDQYKFFLRFSGKSEDVRSGMLDAAADEYLRERDENLTCKYRLKDKDCKSIMTRAYLQAILNAPPLEIAKGLGSAWATLYFGGAASRLSKYLGLEITDLHLIWTGHFKGAESVRDYVSVAAQKHGKYILVLAMFLAFVFVTRILGLVGSIRMFLERRLQPQLTIFVMTLGLFTAMYLFVGITRYRAPLEIILMILAAVGYEKLRTRRPRQRGEG